MAGQNFKIRYKYSTATYINPTDNDRYLVFEVRHIYIIFGTLFETCFGLGNVLYHCKEGHVMIEIKLFSIKVTKSNYR